MKFKERINKNKCFYCGMILTEKNRTRDHIEPINDRKARRRNDDNFVYSCRPCNFAKDNMTLENFKKTTYYKFYCVRKIWKTR